MRYVGNMQMCFSPNDKANPSKKDVTVAIDSTKERLVIFDLSLPIEQQLREARSHLNNESKVENIQFTFRTRTQPYRRFLRLLDASSKNTNNTDIQYYLYPEKESSEAFYSAKSDDLSRAQELCEHYWRIAVRAST